MFSGSRYPATPFPPCVHGLPKVVTLQEFTWHPCISVFHPFMLGGDWWLWSVRPHLRNYTSVCKLQDYSTDAAWGTVNPCKEPVLDPKKSPVQTFAQHLVCNPLGACLDLRYFLLLNGTLYNSSSEAEGNSTNCSLSQSSPSYNNQNCSFPLHRDVCVSPPFAFLLSDSPGFNCSNEPCTLSECWNGFPVYSILVYRPSYAWVPVNVTDWVGPVSQTVPVDKLTFTKSRRPRGIKDWLWNVAGVAASLFVPAVGNAVLQAWTSQQLALTMEAVNNLANLTRDTLRHHNQMLELNSQAIQHLQTEIDELGLEIDGLWRVLQQRCDTRWLFGRLCVTPVRVNLTEKRQNVATWLRDTYLPKFTNLSNQVESGLLEIGEIQLKPVTFDLSTLAETVKNLWDRFTSWFSWPNLTTWLLLIVGLLVGLVVIKCLLERLFQAQQQLRVATMMAMSSPLISLMMTLLNFVPHLGHSGRGTQE